MQKKKKGSDIFVIGEGPWPCSDMITFCEQCHENMENADPDEGQAHHSLTDGYHVGLFYTLLQRACNHLELPRNDGLDH